MTNYTPEQMRALADDLGRGNSGRYRSEIIADAESVIRSTADQLDAYMQKVASRVIDVFENADDDATAEDVMPEVFSAIGLLQHHGVSATPSKETTK